MPASVKHKGVPLKDDSDQYMPIERTFSIDNDDDYIEPGAAKPKKKRPIKLR